MIPSYRERRFSGLGPDLTTACYPYQQHQAMDAASLLSFDDAPAKPADETSEGTA
jgi:hypothetical protein